MDILSILSPKLDSTKIAQGFPSDSVVKNLPASCRRCKGCGVNPWVGKIPWRREWQPTPIFLPGESHGQRNLAGYSPWGRRRVRHDLETKQQQGCSTKSTYLQAFPTCGPSPCPLLLPLGPPSILPSPSIRSGSRRGSLVPSGLCLKMPSSCSCETCLRDTDSSWTMNSLMF